MNSIELFLVMVVAVLACSYLVQLLPFPVPLPLVQIFAGSMLALFTEHAVQLQPEVFFLLFLPPLLFLDGWRIPKDGLKRDRGRILELAFGLVFFSVGVGGPLIHLLIPSIPLSVAFALAAVISPTDPVAVSAIAARTPIPGRLMHVLEGESLLNDASGLLSFRLAVGVVLGTAFSWTTAATTLLWSVFAGVLAGLVVTLLLTTGQRILERRLGTADADAPLLVTLVIPFAAYLLAEQVHASGILAVVAAGMAMSRVELTGLAPASSRLQRNAFWNTVQLLLNGIMFVVLGEQLPRVALGAMELGAALGREGGWWLTLYAVSVAGGMMLLRLAWLTFSAVLPWHRGDRRSFRERLPENLVLSVAGVRGAVTLAGVLTLPLALTDGSPFPARDLAIFLAASVILISITASGLFLPRLLRRLTPMGDEHGEELAHAQGEAARAAVQAIQGALARSPDDAELAAVAAPLLEAYRSRAGASAAHAETRRFHEAEQRLRMLCLRAERDALFSMARAGRLSDATARRLVHDIDLLEAHIS